MVLLAGQVLRETVHSEKTHEKVLKYTQGGVPSNWTYYFSVAATKGWEQKKIWSEEIVGERIQEES